MQKEKSENFFYWLFFALLVLVLIGGGVAVISTNGKLNDKLDHLFLKFAEKWKIDPALLKTIAQLESSIGSPRGRKLEPIGQTYGLMHVRLNTANWLRDMVKLPHVSFEDLASDELQIDLAAQYVAYLLKFFKGDKEKAIMAYNGGQGNVQRGTISDGAKKYYQDFLKYRQMIA